MAWERHGVNDAVMVLRIPTALKAAIRRVSARKRLSMNSWVLNQIEAGVNSIPLRPETAPRTIKGKCTRCRCTRRDTLATCLCFCHGHVQPAV